MQLGERIRARRKELKLSLRELAQRVDLTDSFLSLIERNLSSPSIESLRKISNALEVPIFYFLVEEDPKSPVVRHNRRIKMRLPDSDIDYELLTPDLNRKIEAFLAEREPGKERIATPLRQYSEELIYVLQGQLEVQVGEDTYVLDAGDSIYFEGPLLRRVASRGEETARFISIVTPPIF